MPTTIDVRFYELDPYGHVNHGVYLNYFEVARIELLEEIGFGLPRLRELGFHLLVVEAHVRFLAPATAGDRLVVHSELAELRRASAVWHQRILRGDELIATNEVRSAITDANGRPIKAPPQLTEALLPYIRTDTTARTDLRDAPATTATTATPDAPDTVRSNTA